MIVTEETIFQHTVLLNRPILRLIPKKSRLILDVACGYGNWGYLIRMCKQCECLVGLEVWKPYLDRLRGVKIYDVLIQCELPCIPFKSNSFDVVLASEILEHMNYEDGLTLLNEMERVANGTIIISTPIDLPQNKTIDGNPFNKHKSEWNVKTLEKMGYKVEKVKGLPKTLQIVDKFRRVVMRLGKAPTFLIAEKKSDG